MVYQPQQRIGARDSKWLALLVMTFEATTRDVGTPNAAAIAGLKAQLAMPQASLVAKSNRLH